MTHPASAVTWSMTSQGLPPFRGGRVVKCALCGCTFSTTSSRAKYCSDACRTDGHRKTRKANTVRVCKGCQSTFSPAWNRQSFCSVTCRCKHQGRAPRGRRFTSNQSGMAMELCPDAVDGVAPWVASADWDMVERTWVALFVEQFAHDGNRAAMARALANVRKRYRAAMLAPEMSATE